jgi:hypothetical protein
MERLLDLLELEKIVRKTRAGWRLNRKVLIFCQHRGVAVGVSRLLRRLLASNEPDSANATDQPATLPLVASNADPEDLRRASKWWKGQRGKEAPARHRAGSHSDDVLILVNGFLNPKGLPKVLVATDALSESVDLHRACKRVVHYELPWSPLRLYQRIGRLTRLKQTGGRLRMNRDVRVGHVIIPGSVEEERVNRLIRRIQFMREQDLWPDRFSDEELMAGLIGSGPSLHYAEMLKQ